jgi:hypothetical protein
MSFVVAHAFNCDLQLSQILKELRAQTEFEWIERDSFFWGDYISAGVFPGVIAKVFIEDPGYLFEIKFDDDALRADWERAARQVRDQVLSLIGACDVKLAPSNN